MSESKQSRANIIEFRKSFRRARLDFVRRHGICAYDQAQALYVCGRTGEEVVVTDAFPGQARKAPIEQVIESLSNGWLANRRNFKSDDSDLELELVAGVYAAFLPEVGFDYTIEFDLTEAADRPVRCWRVDGAGKASKLIVPSDEGTFHAQSGTFHDLRAGWRWLISSYAKDGRLRTEEVERGYFIGVRKGMPGDTDPAARDDEELEHAFSAHVNYGFDVLEFIGSTEAQKYPFQNETASTWLGEYAAPVAQGVIDMFVLANTDYFKDVVMELCETKECTLRFEDIDEQLVGHLGRGELSIRLDLGELMLRGIHTGRTFCGIAQDFIGPHADDLFEATVLLESLVAKLGRYDLSITDGCILTVKDGSTSAQWNMLNLVGQQHEGSYVDGVLRLMGFDPETGDKLPAHHNLESCSICHRPARIDKLIRPKQLIGRMNDELTHIDLGDHTVYYTASCDIHSVPITGLEPSRLTELEALCQKHQKDAITRLISHSRDVEDVSELFIGYDMGSLLLEAGRVRTLIESQELSGFDACHAYGLFPDALLLSRRALNHAERARAETNARERLEALYPDRIIALKVARTIDLTKMALGKVEWTQ